MRRIVKIIVYYLFSRSKKQLDKYMHVIRTGQKLSDAEVNKLQELIHYERAIYDSE